MMMSKIEGYTSLSSLDRRSASKYYLFILVNVFLGSVITGTAFQQLHSFLHQSANAYVKILFYLLSCTCLYLPIFSFLETEMVYACDRCSCN